METRIGEEKVKRNKIPMKKKLDIEESTWGGMGTSYPFPDDGSGVAGDDDRPPGNILIGHKFKQVNFFNKLTNFTRNWVPDAGKWKWDHFEYAGGMEDYDNYSQTLQTMKSLFPEETWDNIWKRMAQVGDKEVARDFAKAGQPWRDASTQLGKDKEISALPPKEIQIESLLDRIDKLII
jgi:hypothetical protein